MWRHQLFNLRQKSWPSLKNQLYNFKKTFTNSASGLQRAKLASEPPKCDLREGEEVEGFTVEEISHIPEFQMSAIRLNHEDTGAQYLHLQREDNNNAFSINLRTTPFDSTGVPHILEHTTLCGSKKYPCRDPFFKMLNRSLATFMNAMTGPDFTMYPFATQNEKDYYNLMSVYMDAVFNPQLKESDFRQEGWRLEHEDVDNPNSPIIFKGVVYNEMKGALSDNQRVFAEGLLNTILPSHTYGVISGGDPLYIPALTYEQLKAFHSKYYHPSNSKFYSYGNFPLRGHLKFINDFYLKRVGKIEQQFSEWSKVPNEKRWQSERKVHMAARVDNMAPDPEKQSCIAISHMCVDITDIEETFTLNVLAHLLTSGPNSEFYKSLVEPNIGSGFTLSTGYDNQTKDTYFSVGLQGVNTKDFDLIVEKYDNTIDQLLKDGFDKKRIDAILHSIELNNKHQVGDYGLRFLYSLCSLWNHDGDVIRALRVNNIVNKFKDQLSRNPNYLLEKTEQYLKKNTHKLILTMSPDDKFEEKKSEEEKVLLQSKLSDLTPEMKNKVYENGIKLRSEQDKKQNVDCLPSLKTSDLEKNIKKVRLTEKKYEGVPVQLSLLPTNEITYVKGVLSTSHISQDLKGYVPIFASFVTKLGTEKHDYRDFDKMVQLKTGGLGLSLHLAEKKDDSTFYEHGLLFASHALDINSDSMFHIWTEVFKYYTLKDKSRLETLMKSEVANMVSSLDNQGHFYVISASSSLVNPAAFMAEYNGGLTYVKRFSNLVRENNFEEVLAKLDEIGKTVFNKRFMRLAANFSAENETAVLKSLETFVRSLDEPFEKSSVIVQDKPSVKINKGIHFETSFPVSYASKSIPTVPYMHNDYAALRIMSRLLSSKYLLPIVREKGGAYGAGCRTSPGVLSFFSYRDPKPENTFKVFDDTLNWVNKLDFNDQDIEEAKLGTFQTIDAPETPGSKGSREFLYGISHDEFESYRLKLMGVTRDDIVRVASTYLDPSRDVSVGRSLLGPQNSEVCSRQGEEWVNEKL